MNILSWSGGKDSTASIILARQHNIPIDEILMAQVMYDHSRNIPADNLEQYEWINSIAIPKIQGWGYKVTVVKSEHDYLWHFNHVTTQSHKPGRNGKLRGFTHGRHCFILDDLKLKPMAKYKKQLGDITEILGIACDEQVRLERMHKRENNISLLEQYHVTEQDAMELCRENDLLSPIYGNSSRGGCWFCPNARDKERLDFRRKHPNLWHELVELGKKDTISPYFTYGRTIAEVDQALDVLDSQITIFDLL